MGEIIPADTHLYAEFFSYPRISQVAINCGQGLAPVENVAARARDYRTCAVH